MELVIRLAETFYEGGFYTECAVADSRVPMDFAPMLASMIRAMKPFIAHLKMDKRAAEDMLPAAEKIFDDLKALWVLMASVEITGDQVEPVYNEFMRLVKRFMESST